MLGIITFSCVLGLVISKMDSERSERLLYVIDSLNIAIQKMVGIGMVSDDLLLYLYILVIWLSPIGVLSLISYYMGASGGFWEVVKGMAMLIAARFTGVLVHGLFVLPIVYFLYVILCVYGINLLLD